MRHLPSGTFQSVIDLVIEFICSVASPKLKEEKEKEEEGNSWKANDTANKVAEGNRIDGRTSHLSITFATCRTGDWHKGQHNTTRVASVFPETETKWRKISGSIGWVSLGYDRSKSSFHYMRIGNATQRTRRWWRIFSARRMHVKSPSNHDS